MVQHFPDKQSHIFILKSAPPEHNFPSDKVITLLNIGNGHIASASAFQPNPYIALYSASKAYLLSFTRSLNVENEGITCTAVCPGWVDTKMLPKTNKGKEINYPGMVNAGKVVDVALKDARKGRDVSVCSFYYRYMRFLSKVMPHRLEMKLWVNGIKEYI